MYFFIRFIEELWGAVKQKKVKFWERVFPPRVISPLVAIFFVDFTYSCVAKHGEKVGLAQPLTH